VRGARRRNGLYGSAIGFGDWMVCVHDWGAQAKGVAARESPPVITDCRLRILHLRHRRALYLHRRVIPKTRAARSADRPYCGLSNSSDILAGFLGLPRCGGKVSAVVMPGIPIEKHAVGPLRPFMASADTPF
jgi:hypothetical protein